jgi:hypothetical protein
MPQTQSPPVEYASRGERPRQRSLAGAAAVIVSLVLSPFTVVGGFVANDDVREMMGGPISIQTIVVLMVVAVVVPLAALAYILAFRRSGLGWALLGLFISVVGWGGLALLAMNFPQVGGAPGGH